MKGSAWLCESFFNKKTLRLKMEILKEYLSDDQILYLIEKVGSGRKLEAARSLQYYLIERYPMSLPDAISIVIKMHAEFVA